MLWHFAKRILGFGRYYIHDYNSMDDLHFCFESAFHSRRPGSPPTAGLNVAAAARGIS